MKLANREDIRKFILQIEKDFPVNDWKFNQMHLWPLLRLELFFFIRKQFNLKNKLNENSGQVQVLNKKTVASASESLVSRIVGKFSKSLQHLKFIGNLDEKENVFFAHNDHRIIYEGVSYNRFFDTLINTLSLSQTSYMLEIGDKESKQLANPGIIIQYREQLENYKAYLSLRRFFTKEKISFELEDYDLLLDFLNKNEVTKGFSEKFSKSKLRELVINEYNLRFLLFKKVLGKIKPKRLIALCYYSDLSLIAAANKLNIETIDMQHGAQAPAHLAYGSWSNIPAEGYNFLPRNYWCWNEQSRSVISEWAVLTEKYRSFVGGNVWVDHWMGKNDPCSSTGFILYTLQPDSLTLNQLFPDSLIREIRSGKHKWFIRLHPRQLKNSAEITAYLEQHGIFNLVNIDDATKEPLPLLLKHCLIHVTNSSASAIEASLFGKKTILLHEIGKLYYADLISESKAVFIAPDPEFQVNFDKVLSSLKITGEEQYIAPDYSRVFSQ
ncbi:MAG: hypothetical protein ACJ76F_12910 [Bacteroidia bacterium]